MKANECVLFGGPCDGEHRTVAPEVPQIVERRKGAPFAVLHYYRRDDDKAWLFIYSGEELDA